MKSFEGRFFWVFYLYFFSGLPLGFFYTFLPVYFRFQGVDLVSIGLLSSASIFWSLKPLWAPLIDKYSQKKNWMAFSLLGISTTIFLLSLSNYDVSQLWLLLSLLTFFSALFDTALDGFIIDYIPPEKLASANGLRLSAYRIALIFSGGVLTAISEYLQFKFIFQILAFISLFAALLIITNKSLQVTSKPQKILSLKEQYLQPLKEIMEREKIVLIFLFIATYKVGDALLGGMIYPFWVDRGFSRLEIGLISGTLGSMLTIAGSLFGGFFVTKYGLRRSLLFLGFLQAFSNLGYTLVALPEIDKKWVYLASAIESLTGGMGTSAFVTFLTFNSKREFSSTQYALFSTLFSLTMTFSRTISGWGASQLGYFNFFGLTFLIALLPLPLVRAIVKN
ncbi:MAG: MFS transporter [Caldimicrobium sp.]|nr:MFS transporter [Caldimicrobium sp.]MCX7874416.1 MFS transporter [Caldimicrobium sp.]MDW8093999.1 MFS transporter [Caldimicrobium sp.]